MGVTCVCQWPIPEGRSSQQALEPLHKKLELLGGTKTGYYCVDCETYTSNQTMNLSAVINVMHNTEYPFSVFAIVEGGQCLVADNMFDMLMMRMKSFYSKKSAKIEARGQRFELGDFIVKVGAVSAGPNFKGILCEVEYTACVVPAECWSMMCEFMQGLLGPHCPTVPPVVSKPERLFLPQDAMLQYLEHFNHFKKSQSQFNR